jgi:hypothetical protein
LAADTMVTMATARSTQGAGTQHNPAQANGVNGTVAPPGSLPPPSARLVVETKVGVDFLDDGYHWRKYGQKNVKGTYPPPSASSATQRAPAACSHTMLVRVQARRTRAATTDVQRRTALSRSRYGACAVCCHTVTGIKMLT